MVVLNQKCHETLKRSWNRLVASFDTPLRWAKIPQSSGISALIPTLGWYKRSDIIPYL